MIEDYFTEIESLLIASPIVLSFKTSKEKISDFVRARNFLANTLKGMNLNRPTERFLRSIC